MRSVVAYMLQLVKINCPDRYELRPKGCIVGRTKSTVAF